jgi:lysophospholipase L1-like esterase
MTIIVKRTLKAYGQDLLQGQSYTLSADQEAALILQGDASDAAAAPAVPILPVVSDLVGNMQVGGQKVGLTQAEVLAARSSLGRVSSRLMTPEQMQALYVLNTTPADYELDFTVIDALPSGVTATAPKLSARGAYVSSATDAITIALATVLPSLVATAWSAEVEVELDPSITPTTQRTVFEFGGTTNNRHSVGLAGSAPFNCFVGSNISTSPSLSVVTYTDNPSSVIAGNVVKMTVSCTGGGAVVVANNTHLCVSRSDLQAISGTLSLSLGWLKSLGGTSGQYLFGWVRSVKIWQAAISSKRLYASVSRKDIGIVCYGDSLTQGSGASPASNGYPQQLSALCGVGVTNKGIAGYTSTQIRAVYFANTDTTAEMTHVLWIGRNDGGEQSTIIPNVAAIASRIKHGRYIVLSIINRSDGTENKGSSAYNAIIAANAALQAAYGDRYLDVRSLLVGGVNASVDAPDPATSADGLHLTSAGYAIVANAVNAKLKALGYLLS